ncbi:MAG: hypothetical protein MJ112_07350 [Lachnospiraceae bacterium]|nr:hypothetical protein [Lachnospiraceae bacterium]
MKKENTSRKKGNNTSKKNNHHKDIEIMEIDKPIDGEADYNEEYGESDAEDNDSGKIIHIAFILLVIGLITAAVIMLVRWNKGKDLVIDEDERESGFNIESMDYYSRFDPTEDYVDDGELNIVIMGDDFLCQYNDETGIPALIKEATGGNVTTLALEGQTISNIASSYSMDETRDSFNLLLTLVQLCGGDSGDFSLSEAALEYIDDNEKYKTYMEQCKTIDLDDVDVLIIMLGQNDYILGRKCYLDQDADEKDNYDLSNMTVTLSRSLSTVKERFPNLQVIMASPSMMKTTDKNGNLVGADTVNNGYAYYGNYISGIAGMSQLNCVTFVDNYLLPDFNPDNYEEYLEPNGLYPNEKARKMIADHIVENLYFNRQSDYK